jgi:hypothetical protein
MPWPRVVAEALRSVADPARLGAASLAIGPLATTLQRIADAETVGLPSGPAPAFLLPHQIEPWRRVAMALRGWDGVLLAERPGTGKTWIALGVASRHGGPVVAIVPSIVRAQWESAATLAQVRLNFWTHERLSRGTLPPFDAGLVIVDEAHRFRDLSSRRSRTLAPWLVGRKTLLISATPIVNRVADLIGLLRLVVSDDALALDGIQRLTDLQQDIPPGSALRRVAVRSTAAPPELLARRTEVIHADDDEIRRGEAAVALIGRLVLSESKSVKRLVRSVLLDAAASSDAALWSALHRYRALLLQSRDAGGASRAMLRRFAGEALDQLVFWPLLELEPSLGDLPHGDIAYLDRVLAAPAPAERWIAEIAHRCADGAITTCFARHRATAQRLRETMGDSAAWVTGAAAGIGPHRMDRGTVLAAFGPSRASWQSRRHVPLMLIATDVAAEGLDLHAAGRIVHVDLPWTAMRIEQREGRLLRIGQHHHRVDVMVRMPAPAIEAALAPAARIDRKGALTRQWLAGLEFHAAGSAPGPSQVSVTAVRDGETPATIVAVQLARGPRHGRMIVTQIAGTAWTSDLRQTRALVDRARRAAPSVGPVDQQQQLIGEGIRAALALASPEHSTPCTALITRVHRLARRAAKERDAAALARLDRLLRFVAASPTVGARAILSDLCAARDDELGRADVPDYPCASPVTACVVGAIFIQ